MAFTIGQRWISNTESELGLGIVVALTPRQVTLLFPACDENRIYAQGDAPVTRVIFNPGDTITSHEGWQLVIRDISEQQGILYYQGIRADNQQKITLCENLLDSKLVFSRPQDRLFSGNSEPMNRFVLRYHARQYYSQQYRQPYSGLRGIRASLIPHQLHIAHQVANRFAPRVLLADEVGLGKTIEAGMIIHQRVLAGSAQRVLIVVPENLQHQWLVEMLRRFNLHFALFDESRYAAVLEQGDSNPFDSEQMIICSLDFICASPQRLELLSLAQWDLLVVDEAHHLVWHQQTPGEAYRCVQQLAQQIPAVLLLTATPEQLGMSSHFARLRLLDGNRFHDFNQFLAEQQQYRPVADAVNLLLEGAPLQPEQIHSITAMLKEQDISGLITQLNGNNQQSGQARQQLISMLLDRHGTSRLLFRNTRQGVAGFPQRQLHRVKLPLPAAYQAAFADYLSRHASATPQQQVAQLLNPEQLYQSATENASWQESWYSIDPRVQWLKDYLLQHRRQKVLVICASADTALTLEQALRESEGIRAAVFYEEMSIIERDRAAAWFADQQSGAQVLICSEIGSEGRNFQFASTLVMFDLPLNADLLEQRIGRLDRIGQRHAVQIYVPYMENTAQAVLLRWYHEGLNAFEHTCSSGQPIYEQFADQLVLQLLASCMAQPAEAADPAPLIAACRQQHEALKQQLEQGRDRLLEINSSGGDQAQQLAASIAAQDNDSALRDFCNILFDIIGIHHEELDDQLYVLTPDSNMLIPDFPGIPQEGCTITFSREMALAREDVQFLSWEHPIIRNGLDLILSGDIGICALALLKFPELPVGTLLLELLYVVETSAAKQLQLQRFLPPVPVRMLLNKNGEDMAHSIAFKRLQNRLEPVNRQLASKFGSMVKDDVSLMLRKGELLAERAAKKIISEAKQQASVTLTSEIDRLLALKEINPAVRSDEIQALTANRDQVLASLEQAHWRLDALRLVVVTQ